MKLKALYIISILVVCNIGAIAQGGSLLQRIHSIKLLETTDKEIEATFGKPKKEGPGQIWKYEVGEGDLDITFTDGRCVTSMLTGALIGWKVPAWRVQEVAFSPRQPISPKKLGVRLNDFEVRAIEDSKYAKEYFNKNKGEYYILNSSGNVEDIILIPALGQHNLRCK